jgi:hypothetical protein
MTEGEEVAETQKRKNKEYQAVFLWYFSISLFQYYGREFEKKKRMHEAWLNRQGSSLHSPVHYRRRSSKFYLRGKIIISTVSLPGLRNSWEGNPTVQSFVVLFLTFFVTKNKFYC